MKKLLTLCMMIGMTICHPALAQVGLFIRPDSSSLSSPVTGQTWFFNSSNYVISTWNGSAFQIVSAPKGNFTASAAPTIHNDSTQGYSQGSVWYNTVSGNYYACVDATSGAAVWILTNNLGALSIPLSQLQQGGATTGQSLLWNGTTWAPGSPNILLSHILQSSALVGQIPQWNGTNWVAASVSGTGSVTSVAITGDGTIFGSSISGSPVTSSGTFNLASSLLNQASFTSLAGSNYAVFSNPPTFRPLTQRDLPTTQYEPIANGSGILPALPMPWSFVDGTITEYTSSASPTDICVGPNNHMYVCYSGSSTIEEYSTGGTLLNTFTVPASGAPTAICYGPNNFIYFVDSANSAIGQMSLSGTFTMTPTLTTSTALTGICIAGPYVWFCENDNQIYGKMTLDGAFTITEYSTSFGAQPYKICAGIDGRVCFTSNTGTFLGVATANINNGTAIYQGIPSAVAPSGIASGTNNRIWFTDSGANLVGFFDPATFTWTEFTPPTGSSAPGNICAGPDGNMHFIENAASKIATVTPGGTITETSLPTGSANAAGMCVGGDGGIWTIETANNKLAAQALTMVHR